MITYTKIRKDLFTICVGTLLPCYLQGLGNWLYFFKNLFIELGCKFVEELILYWVEDVWSWNSELQVEDFCPRKIEVLHEFGYQKVVIIANSLGHFEKISSGEIVKTCEKLVTNFSAVSAFSSSFQASFPMIFHTQKFLIEDLESQDKPWIKNPFLSTFFIST